MGRRRKLRIEDESENEAKREWKRKIGKGRGW